MIKIGDNGYIYLSNTTALAITNSINSLAWYPITNGIVQKPSQCFFAAMGTNSTFVDLTAGTWNKIPATRILLNVGSAYDASLARFTAPVTGIYHFTGSTYLTNSVTTDLYYHPVFFVNGSNGRNANPSYTNYRIRHYGYNVSGYDDGMIQQMYYLVAGDYVEYYHYLNIAGGQYYDAYTRFSGILIG